MQLNHWVCYSVSDAKQVAEFSFSFLHGREVRVWRHPGLCLPETTQLEQGRIDARFAL